MATKIKKSNAGRKRLPKGEKIIPMYIYPKQMYLTKLGEDNARRIGEDAIIEAYNART
jgi:hypothetical protein